MATSGTSDQLNLSSSFRLKPKLRTRVPQQKKKSLERYGKQRVHFKDDKEEAIKSEGTTKNFLVRKDPWTDVNSKLPPVTKTVVQNSWIPVSYELDFSPVPTGKGPQYLYEVKG